MPKLNTLKTAIIAGNHMINASKEITFDKKALEFGQKLRKEIPTSQTICLLDNVRIEVPTLCKSLSKSLLRPKLTIVDEVITQIPLVDFVIFESSIKNKAKHKKTTFCSILGPNSYTSLDETRKCNCWGLGVITILSILELGFEKVIFVTSPKSQQLKVFDALKIKQFFENDIRFELIWAK
jgi:hypothetical protein